MRDHSSRRDRAPVARVAPHPAQVAGRVPPHDLDSEAATISAALLAPLDVIDQVRDILAREQFYSDANGLIWEAIVDLHTTKQKVDIVSVASWLRDREKLAQIGGASYLAQLADATPAVAHVMQHARAVLEKWRLRTLIAECQITAGDGYGPVEDVQRYLDDHSARVHDVATKASGDPMLPLGHGLTAKLEGDWRACNDGRGMMGISTGLKAFDHKIAGLHPGGLYIIAGRPGMGKTALACGMAVAITAPPDAAESLFLQPAEYGVAVFSLEMPRDDLQIRFTCTEALVNLGAYRAGQLDPDGWRRVFEASTFLSPLPIWIDDTPRNTLPKMRAKLRKMVAAWCREGKPATAGRGVTTERKLGAIIIDYLQLVDGEQHGRSREEEVAHVSRELKALAKDFKVPVIALAQLNRAVETRNTKDKRPQMSDLRDSGGIEQDADLIVFVYRDEYYNPGNTERRGIAELIIAKQRNGPTGKVLVRFDGQYTRFSNLSADAASAYTSDGGDDE